MIGEVEDNRLTVEGVESKRTVILSTQEEYQLKYQEMSREEVRNNM